MIPGRTSLAFLCVLLLCALTAGAAPVTPSAEAGRLVLPRTDAVVPLQGQWGFAWQRFVDPAWQQLPTRDLAPVPASWNELTADGKPPGQDGWGSYALLVDCPRGQSLAIEARGQRTASRLFVNGEEVAAHGEPGPSPQRSFAAVHDRVPITREFACPLRLTLHISNFDHRSGGFIRPMMAGPRDLLVRARESRVIYGTALLAAYLLTSVVALIFFAVRRQQRVPLVFGLFCIAMAIYTDMIGERLFLRWFPPQVSWFAYMRVEYLSWVAAMALFFLTLRGLFPAEIHRRVVQAVLGLLGLGAVAVLALPPAVYSHVVVPGQAIAVLVAGYVAFAMLRAGRGTRGDARVLLAGMVVVLLALAVDLLLIDSAQPDRKLAPIGFAFFLISPAMVIARRMSHALNAEQRSRALEENARLREDVERISRHDLKTPLNSIIGATRLLRDDPRLTGDQRELLGVLQRSALRMLEMVNLSLGLFRMETGSYDFRPQAVDVRQVVTRVLVDLHSYADAHSVLLHWQDPDPAPVYARVEELLCYSILANLVKNAVEAAGAGGQVAVTLQRGDPLVLEVHNPGEVPAGIAQRFFEKYVTAGKSGGTGLGTYSARLMARAQGGELRMRTGPQGTTLALTLPRLKGEAPVLPATVTPEGTPSEWAADMPPRTVLVVDDDEFTRLVTRRLLPSPPFRVSTAANGEAAIEAMAQGWPDYLLLDMEMPLRSGVDTVTWVREQEAAHGHARCRVLMVSGNDDEASATRALQAGADRYLVKPVSRERLLNTLREMEDAGRPPADTLPPPSSPPSGSAADDEAAPADIVVVDAEWEEVLPDVMRMQRETVDRLAQAVAAGDRKDVQFLAHRVYGGLATLGLQWAAHESRTLERTAEQAPMAELEGRVRALRAYLHRVRLETR